MGEPIEGSICEKRVAWCDLDPNIPLIRPVLPQPTACLIRDGRALSTDESHEQWCRQLVEQSKWPGEHDKPYEAFVNGRVASLLGNAWKHRGKGTHDYHVSLEESRKTYKDWDVTNATTPDLVPRCIFGTSIKEWHVVLWRLMDIAGPACLACRPKMWRGAAAVPLFKKGAITASESFRLIMIKSQMGLLQEGLLFNRLSSQVRSSITPGQSGYIRDVGHAHLLLHT